MKAVSVKTMRESDAWTIANRTSSKELMRRAGEGIYKAVCWKEPVAIVCGKGNNAGDGFVVADLLTKAGKDCTIFLLSDMFSEDGRYYYEICVEEGVKTEHFRPGETNFSGFGSVLDCLLGTGFQGSLREPIRSAVEAINASGVYVVSADINSGLNGDTGEGELCVVSDMTVSIGTFKTGHFRGRANEVMKEKVNCDIGIEIIGPYEEI